MGFSLYLVINTGVENKIIEEIGSMTYNLSPMIYKAIPTLTATKDFNEKKCVDLIPVLQNAVKNMTDQKEEYEKLNPKNGWGDYQCCLSFMQRFLLLCKENPNGSVIWSG